MQDEFSLARPPHARRAGNMVASPSTDKARRTMLLAVLFQVSWPKRLTRSEITDQLHMYGENPNRAFNREGCK